MPKDIHEQYDKIYRYCYFKVKNAALAEDLTQETFLKYFNQNTYIDRGKQMAYLYTIARNLCTDSFRQKVTTPLAEEPSANDPIGKAELALALRQALNLLPSSEQEILLLRYANELSVGEIAAFTGLSRFTVYRKTKNALAILKSQLRKEDFL